MDGYMVMMVDTFASVETVSGRVRKRKSGTYLENFFVNHSSFTWSSHGVIGKLGAFAETGYALKLLFGVSSYFLMNFVFDITDMTTRGLSTDGLHNQNSEQSICHLALHFDSHLYWCERLFVVVLLSIMNCKCNAVLIFSIMIVVQF